MSRTPDWQHNVVEYEKQTVNNPNPFARFAHRRRLKIALQRVLELPEGSLVVDYGCGQGRFLSEIDKASPSKFMLMGWDPIQSQLFDGYAIVDDLAKIAPNSVDMIVCLEVCEHLNEDETETFLAFAKSRLKSDGRLLVTVPVMIGPALILKELNRMILFRRRP